jgi:phenylpyruvate tautomerase PptA (4-oxalocrotonate tautomerase family)
LQKETDSVTVRFVPQLTQEVAAVPMIDVTTTPGALTGEQRDALAARLTETILKWEGASEIPFSRQITVVHFDEQPVYVAGEPATTARYRVLVTIPEGSITDDERKAGLVADATRDVLAVDGDEGDEAAFRVWVFIHEVPDGHWGGAGRVFRFRDIVRLAKSGGERVPA